MSEIGLFEFRSSHPSDKLYSFYYKMSLNLGPLYWGRVLSFPIFPEDLFRRLDPVFPILKNTLYVVHYKL